MSERGALRTANATQPYRGRAGQTRSESVQVWMPAGEFRTLHVYVSVDASADPALAKAAREGALHAVTDEVELAVPFVYHDPALPLFALVIPEALRHQALSLRAQALSRIADDPAHEVPAYVADCECVVGAAGLRARIEQGARVPVDWDAGAQAELQERREELSRWEASLRARERELRSRTDPTGPGRRPRRQTTSLDVDDEELEEVPPSLTPSYFEQGAVEALRYVREEPLRDSALQVEDGELLDAREGPSSVTPPPLPFAMLSEPEQALEGDDVPPPPEAFAADYERNLFAAVCDGRVWVYTRGLPAPSERGELELLVQVDPEVDPAVVLLTLVHSDRGGSVSVLRHPLRAFEPEGRAVLEKLAQRFVVELVYVGETSLLSYEATLAAPREHNARAVLEYVDGLGSPDPQAYLDAERACLEQPPPWRDRGHPFVTWEEDQQVRSATEAAVELDELSVWLTPARQQRLTLLLSVPQSRVQEHTARAIRDALGFGLSLPEPLVEHALARGLADDETDLFKQRLAGLRRTSGSEDGGGMDQRVLATLWLEALQEAARRGVALDAETLAVAERYVGDKAASLVGDARQEPLTEELAALQASPPSIDAAYMLAERGGPAELRAVCEAAEKLEPAPAARVFAALAERGSEAVDALLATLERAGPRHARFGAALALSSQRAPAGVDALVAAVARAEPPLWQALALALGRYGGGSFRAISRAMRQAGMAEERAALVYAHLSLHGARSPVMRLSRASNTRQAQAGVRAMDLAGELKRHPAAIQGLESDEDLEVLSETFHELRPRNHASTRPAAR